MEGKIGDVRTTGSIEMAINVSYVREMRKTDTVGSRFGFPEAAT